jgi:flagellar biosynthesis protein FlhF
MNIQKFYGKNSREALTAVKKALGEDAIIISNRAINGGNEIMAFLEEDLSAELDHHAMQINPDTAAISFLEHLNNKKLAQELNDEIDNINEIIEIEETAAKIKLETNLDETIKPAKPERTKRTPASLDLPSDEVTQQLITQKNIASMLNEMREMRRSVETQLTTISWSNISPEKSRILNKLLGTGFCAALSRHLVEKLPENLTDLESMNWIKAVLTKNLNTIENENEVLDQGGIFALIGPTGVGKTTTVAKLAARYVMKHGTQNLGIITTDAYRVGGYEQLRIYGKILGVMVHAVKDEDDLKIALNELQNKHTILIDTVGVSQRDQMVAEQISMLSNTNSSIKRLLCINATSTGETLTDVVRAYKGKSLDGCIITKTDEAVTIGNALDTIIREKLKLYYTTDGQRVPEDIHLADKQALIELALQESHKQQIAYQFLSEELPYVMGTTANNIRNADYSELNYA